MIDISGLRALRSSLEADGYRIEVDQNRGRVGISIRATPDACADCLVPKPLLRRILHDALGVAEDAIDLTYPGELGDEPVRPR
jgi:hypothetical protein